MSNDWDELAPDWDSGDTRHYADLALESWHQKIAPRITNVSEIRLLEFGCGTGLLTERLAPICGQVVAVDTSARMIESLRQKVRDQSIGNITSLVATIDSSSANRIPVLADAFDVVVASSVCSFLPYYESTLNDLVSLIRPGGLFAQWDWLGDMPAERIRGAFALAKLNDLDVEMAFEMTVDDQTMPVVLGIGSRP